MFSSWRLEIYGRALPGREKEREKVRRRKRRESRLQGMMESIHGECGSCGKSG